ncbi:MAG: cupin domain-containing protein [Bdellovibrionales bacterium]|nr:cupin domain-containing protein [Bdellovibrionales bacterium]
MKAENFRSFVQYSPDKMLRSQIFKTKHLTTDLLCFEGGQSLKPQKNTESDKVYFILEGKARFTVGRTTREQPAGTLILVKAGQEHGIINLADQRLIIMVFFAKLPPENQKKK